MVTPYCVLWDACCSMLDAQCSMMMMPIIVAYAPDAGQHQRKLGLAFPLSHPCTFSNKIADRRKCFVNVTELQFRSRKKSNYFAADKDVRSDKRQQRAHSPDECIGRYFQHQICQLGRHSKYEKWTMIEAGV